MSNVDKIYCERFDYISCRGNMSIDYEIRKNYQKSTIIQFEENCRKRIMTNVRSGYLRNSYDLVKLCDKSRVIDFYSDLFEVSEKECNNDIDSENEYISHRFILNRQR